MSFNYNSKILLEMLDMSIGGHVENEICSYCKICHNKDHRCKSGDYCKDLIFEGLKEKAEKSIKEDLYIEADLDDDKTEYDSGFNPEVFMENCAEQL